jgi:ligand-binding sensor domain-containing protein
MDRPGRLFSPLPLLALVVTATLARSISAGASPRPAAPTPVPTRESNLAADWVDRTDRFFRAHPELRAPRGSTWKHFVQIKWFLETRTLDGRLPTAADRVRAWEIGRQRRSAAPRRTTGWFALGPVNISGRIVDLKFHPTNPAKIYAASASGGLWISSDGGATWRTTTDDLPSLAIGAVCVLPTNPDVVLIATGEGIHWSYVVYGVGIWKSTDAGETWGPTSFGHDITDNHGFHVMEANPFTGTVLAGANDGLWRSTDEGETWTQVKVGGDYYDVKWKPGSATRVYSTKGGDTSGNRVKVSTDDGLTWTGAGTGQPSSSLVSKTRIAVTPADPSVIYAHYGNSQTYGTLGVYRSMDDGATWSARNTSLNISGSQGSYSNTIAVAPDDVDRVIAGGIQLWLSTDGGLTFAVTGDGTPLGDETAVHYDHHAIAWEPGSTGNLWVGTDGGGWRSTDAGSTWSMRRDGLVTVQYYDVCVAPSDPDLAIGGSQDNGLPVLDGPDTWTISTLIADGFACHFEPLDPDVIYSEWQFGGRVKSTNGALSWFAIQNGISGSSRPFAPLELDPNQTGRLFTSTIDNVYRTLNGGDLWVPVASHEATWISVSPVDGNVVWSVDGRTAGAPVRVSTNGGSNWSTAAAYGFSVGNETKIVAHPTDAGTAFVTFAGYDGVAHVARTTNFGATWQNVSGDFPSDPANTLALDPDHPEHWFAGTDTGVWFSSDEGTTWRPLGAGFPNVVVYDLEIHRSARKLVAGTYGRGAWEIDLPAIDGTSVSEVHVRHPDLLLDPPAPNPVRDRALLRFASRRPGRSTVDVHDVRGGRVARVAEVDGGDGIVRTIEWVPDDLAAGVYFVVLRSEDVSVTRKLVLRK